MLQDSEEFDWFWVGSGEPVFLASLGRLRDLRPSHSNCSRDVFGFALCVSTEAMNMSLSRCVLVDKMSWFGNQIVS